MTPPFGVACGETLSLLLTGTLRVVLATVATPDDVQGGSFGRLPDGVGDFVLNTPTPGAANQAYTDPGEALFQPLAPPLRIDFTISPEAEASLRNGATEYDYVEAAVTITGNGLNDGPFTVGVRKKGKVGSRRGFDQKMAWKMDFDRIIPGQSYRRMKKLNLNNMVQDHSTIHEQMAYHVIADAGLPTPRLGNATLFVNGVEFGTYLMLEAFDDDRYLERRLPRDMVSLFEGGLTEAACCDFADVFDNEIGRFEHDAGDEAAGRAALAELVARLDAVAAADVFTSLDSIVDWNQLLTTMAVESIIGHWDGYQISPNNFYMHLSADQKWRWIASGVDQTFGHEGRVDVVFNGAGRLFQRCREDSTCWALYKTKLGEAADRAEALLAGSFSADVDALVAHHQATFSRARLEGGLDNMPDQKASAFAYFAERVLTVRQVLACDGLEDGGACSVRDGGVDTAGTCRFTGAGLSCLQG